MKFTDTNLYIDKKGDGYCIKIAMPDGSRNYLHTGVYGLLDIAISDRDYIAKHNGINEHVIHIREDDKYFRIDISFEIDKRLIQFHSRKLNLSDAFYERLQLMVAED